MDYYKKYLKYKRKYIAIKNQIGKGSLSALGRLSELLRTYSPLNKDKLISDIYRKIRLVNQQELKQELQNLDEIDMTQYVGFLNLKNKIGPNFNGQEISRQIIENCKEAENDPVCENLKLIIKNLGYSILSSCSTEEFMSTVNNSTQCTNNDDVEGSCGEPNFFNELTKANSYNDKLIQILNIIQAKLEPGKTIALIVGETLQHQKGDITLYMDKGEQGDYSGRVPLKNIDTIIRLMQTREDIKDVYNISCTFPTNQIGGNNKEVLDKIIELTETYNVKFINKMCGSCFRSMYYLVHNTTQNFTYEVSPAQGLTVKDTYEIRKCFK